MPLDFSAILESTEFAVQLYKQNTEKWQFVQMDRFRKVSNS